MYSAKLKNPNFGVGIKTGYGFFDFVTAGMLNGETLLIGAETNGGKSMLLSNVSYNMWMGENNIDMSRDELERLPAKNIGKVSYGSGDRYSRRYP